MVHSSACLGLVPLVACGAAAFAPCLCRHLKLKTAGGANAAGQQLAPSWAWLALELMTGLSVVALLLAVGMLLIWHIGLTARSGRRRKSPRCWAHPSISICASDSRNKTTIEHYEGLRVRDSTGLPPGRHIYDLGIFNNLDQVLGENPFLWLLPMPVGVQGNGLRYPTYAELVARRQALLAPISAQAPPAVPAQSAGPSRPPSRLERS